MEDAADEGIVVINQEGRIESLNAAAERLLRYRAHEIAHQRLDQILRQAGQDEWPRMPMRARISPRHDDEKHLYNVHLTIDPPAFDASEKQAPAAESLYRNIVESAHDLVWTLDHLGRWSYLNKAAQTIYGRTPEQMLGRAFADFAAPEFRDQDEQALARMLRGEVLERYETTHLDQSGEAHHLSFSAIVHADDQGAITGISGTARDITEQKAHEQNLAYQAEHDALTGLYNRRYFHKELERFVARAARGGTHGALLYIDLDKFKYINDTLGHAAGDRLLMELTRLMQEHTREGDLLARFGGDEFTLLLYNVDAQDASRVAENLRGLFEQHQFMDDGRAYGVTFSIGIAVIDQNTFSADECLAHADHACYSAKRNGRNQLAFYNPADCGNLAVAGPQGGVRGIGELLDEDRIQLYYQPIVSIASGAAYDYEVLMRAVDAAGELTLPGSFMPAAERAGLVHNVDRHVVSKAIHQLSLLRHAGRPIRFSINLSARAFDDKALLPLIKKLLQDTGLNPALLTFEVTESAAIANLAAATRFITELKEMGCQSALDDFGAGFSSFSQLKHLPVDKLKIDGSYISGLMHGRVNQTLVKSMTQVAHALGKVTVAEFVEDKSTLDLLREYGVDFAQGYYFGAPLPAVPTQRFENLSVQ